MHNISAVAVVALALLTAAGMTAPAFAHGGGHGTGGGAFSASGVPSGFSHGQKRGWKGAGVPPGWSHGQKRGWSGGTMPPGFSHR